MSIWEILNKIFSVSEHGTDKIEDVSDLIIDNGNVVVNFSHYKVRYAVDNHMRSLSRIYPQ